MCFCIFCNNLKIQNGCNFWGEEDFLENWQEYIENFDEIALCRMV